jgi:hypothetical protein
MKPKTFSNIQTRAAQIALLERIQRSITPLCGVLESVNFRSRAQRIYALAKELKEDIQRAEGGQ